MIEVPVTVAFAVVIASAISALFLRIHIEQITFSQFWILGEWFVTMMTAIWYGFRYVYTIEIAAPSQPWLGEIVTIFIIVAGASGFWLTGTTSWAVVIAILLFLGALKDLEIIFARKSHNRVKDSNTDVTNHTRALQTKYLIWHHYYSVVRDLSMMFWWLVYLVIHCNYDVNSNFLIACFGFPYCILVFLWIFIKAKTYEVESGIFGS